MTTRQDQINDIMKEFDFAQIHKVMKALDWQWVVLDFAHPREGVPGVMELKKTAYRLLSTFLDEEPDMVVAEYAKVASGGFEAGRQGNDLYLRFVVEESGGSDFYNDIPDFVKERSYNG